MRCALLLALLAGCGGKTHLIATAPVEGEVPPSSSSRVFKSARFAPDGTFIAFHALDGTRDIVGVMRPDGTDERELADAQTPLASVAWSPDGKSIYFTSSQGVQAVDPVSGTATLVTAAPDATDIDVSLDGSTLLWVKNGATVQSLKKNVAGATPHDETHQGSCPRFDDNGAVSGYVYVGVTNGHPLQRDILGSIGPSGGVTLDLGSLASVSALGAEHYVVSSATGIERVGQDGTRVVIRTIANAMKVDATPDANWILYLVSGKGSLFVMKSL